MSTGYIRQDTGNNISNGQVADATVLDSEFDAIVAAFNSSTGHTHNGTTAEGAAITVIGPAQDVVVSGTSVLPKTTSTYDLGSNLLKWKDLWAGGTSTLASLIATTADINAGTVDGTIIGASVPAAITGTTVNGTTITASVGFVGSVTGNLTSANAVITGGSLNNTPIGATTASTVRGTVITATTNFAGPLTGAVTGNVTGNLTGNVTGNTTGIHTGAVTSSAVTITGGTISGITDLAVADGGTGSSTAAGALVNFGLTAVAADINKLNGMTSSTVELNKLTGLTATTAELNKLAGATATTAELNKLAGATASTTELNYVTGVTSAVQTQLGTKAPLASPALTGTPTAPTAAVTTNTTQIATTAFVNAEISNDVGVANSSLVKTAINASGSAPIFACRAWAHFDGGVAATLYGSGNVASYVRNSTGSYTINFTTAMPDTNFAVVAMSGLTGLAVRELSRTASSITLGNTDGSYVIRDSNYISIAVFR